MYYDNWIVLLGLGMNPEMSKKMADLFDENRKKIQKYVGKKKCAVVLFPFCFFA